MSHGSDTYDPCLYDTVSVTVVSLHPHSSSLFNYTVPRFTFTEVKNTSNTSHLHQRKWSANLKINFVISCGIPVRHLTQLGQEGTGSRLRLCVLCLSLGVIGQGVELSWNCRCNMRWTGGGGNGSGGDSLTPVDEGVVSCPAKFRPADVLLRFEVHPMRCEGLPVDKVEDKNFCSSKSHTHLLLCIYEFTRARLERSIYSDIKPIQSPLVPKFSRRERVRMRAGTVGIRRFEDHIGLEKCGKPDLGPCPGQ
ncbi:hypothetical protein J6590_094840 [Homalodisca vitripennis]|nr:hypothetical protein J6590_094840 [Homalodisca vitripennis]